MQVEIMSSAASEQALTKNPKVSVCVITYNQEKYISQCLQSIVDQVVDFDFEVIVADDCSTDSTQEIIKRFAQKYPSLIVPVLHKNNIGVGFNYRSAHDLARGEYVAHCDGDDMWLPGKLAYQTKLLDKNPDASQCWTCAYLIDDEGKKIGIFPSRTARLLYPKIITAKHIALSYALVGQHSTQMYRRKFKFNFDTTKPVLDFWIAFNMARHGPAIYSKDILSSYRITRSPSMTRSQNKRRATVDYLAAHLADIIRFNPDQANAAKSNLLVRRFVSKLRGHDLSEISKKLECSKGVDIKSIDVFKSVSYFLMQKCW